EQPQGVVARRCLRLDRGTAEGLVQREPAVARERDLRSGIASAPNVRVDEAAQTLQRRDVKSQLLGARRLQRIQGLYRVLGGRQVVHVRSPPNRGCDFLPLPSSTRGGQDATASRTGGLRASNPPPRRFAPPLLDEEGKVPPLALLVEEGRTRQCRGRVVLCA